MNHPLEADLDHVLAHTGDVWDSLRGRRIFITGGTGFVGHWLVESLVWANRRLDLRVAAMLLTRNPDAFRERSPHLANDPAIELLEGDACTFRAPDGMFPIVIHAATERHFDSSPEAPASTFDRDVAATRRVLDFARTHGVERFLFTGSGAVYGRQPPEITHVTEEYAGAPATTDPATPYGQAKRVSEFLCSMYARQFGFQAMIARLFAFVGPYLPLDENFAVGNFLRDVLGGGPVRIAGDGTPWRSYLYGADLAIWLWTILVRGRSAYPYNVGSPHALTIADLARTVVSSTAPGTPVEIAKQPVPGAAAARYVPSTERAECELGLRSLILVDEGVRRTFEWHRGMRR